MIYACTPTAFDTPVDGTLDPGADAGGCDTTAPKKLAVTDPSGLPACCADGASGQAHCLPQDKVPLGYRKQMAACTGGFCIPDALLKSGGAKPASCMSPFGAGACVSQCVPDVAKNKGNLNPNGCAGADELCAPCISPTSMKSTGACEIGDGKDDDACNAAPSSGDASADPSVACPYTGKPIDFTGLPLCPMPGARCVSANNVPASERSMLATCSGGFCVPEVFIAHNGQYIPPTCNSVANNEGRCLPVAIPYVASEGDRLPRDICADTEKCVPCTDPTSGKDTGACHTSCDPGPKTPPIPFTSCCGGLAECIASTTVPASELSRLNSDGCKSAEKCVPKEMTDKTFKPQACTAGFLAGGGAGVCLSKCIELGFFESLAIGQEDCTSDHLCVPCTSGGKPTGAPGCP